MFPPAFRENSAKSVDQSQNWKQRDIHLFVMTSTRDSRSTSLPKQSNVQAWIAVAMTVCFLESVAATASASASPMKNKDDVYEFNVRDDNGDSLPQSFHDNAIKSSFRPSPFFDSSFFDDANPVQFDKNNDESDTEGIFSFTPRSQLGMPFSEYYALPLDRIESYASQASDENVQTEVDRFNLDVQTNVDTNDDVIEEIWNGNLEEPSFSDSYKDLPVSFEKDSDDYIIDGSDSSLRFENTFNNLRIQSSMQKSQRLRDPEALDLRDVNYPRDNIRHKLGEPNFKANTNYAKDTSKDRFQSSTFLSEKRNSFPLNFEDVVRDIDTQISLLNEKIQSERRRNEFDINYNSVESGEKSEEEDSTQSLGYFGYDEGFEDSSIHLGENNKENDKYEVLSKGKVSVQGASEGLNYMEKQNAERPEEHLQSQAANVEIETKNNEKNQNNLSKQQKEQASKMDHGHQNKKFQIDNQKSSRSKRAARESPVQDHKPSKFPGKSAINMNDVRITEELHLIEEYRRTRKPCPREHDSLIMLHNIMLPPEKLHPIFQKEVKQAVRAANSISDLLMYISTESRTALMAVFSATTQSIVDGSPLVMGCGITYLSDFPFNSHDTSNGPTSFSSPVPPSSSASSMKASSISFSIDDDDANSSSGSSPSSSSSSSSPSSNETSSEKILYPYAYRIGNGDLIVTDLSKLYNPQKTVWFSYHANRSADGLLRASNRLVTNGTDVGNLNSIVANWTQAVVVKPEDGFWAPSPYYDCDLRHWVVQYSVPFYQLEKNTPLFKGVVFLDVSFESISFNQCEENGSLFAGTHRCPQPSTQCKNAPQSGFVSGGYQCVCAPGFRFPSHNGHVPKGAYSGSEVERAFLAEARNLSHNYSRFYQCVPMSSHSSSLPPNSTPVTGEGAGLEGENGSPPIDYLVRGIPLGIQSFCMTVALVVGIVLVCLRKTKVMRSSIWVLLELFIFGAILLYATVVIQYFPPTTSTCLLIPWFREVGFAIVYGVLVLKIYRILAEFQSRKAHRVHVRDKDLIKYLAVILIVVIAYMLAWTAVNMDHLDHNSTILEPLYLKEENQSYTLCRSMWWDYVIEIGEFVFLCFGMYMCYCVRSAPTEYSEGRYITGAICYEALASAIFYILKHLWWDTLHPDRLFLMYFLRCQLTVTVVLIIILGPKLWYAHRPPDDEHSRSRAYSQSDVQDSSSPETMKLNVGISSNGDVEVGEINLAEMDPEDIRAELRRVYIQLQIYKTKMMRKDNPHISKRRGGRKQTHRRFSLQAFHHKHRHHHDHDHEHEMSKTPEESTNSAEGMAFTMEPSVKEEPHEGRSGPSVSFKPGHK